jgi:hypothetical protein
MPSSDIFMLVVGIGSFVVLWLYVALCNRA